MGDVNKVECDVSTATALGVRWEVKSFQEETIVWTGADGGDMGNLGCLLVGPNLQPQIRYTTSDVACDFSLSKS